MGIHGNRGSIVLTIHQGLVMASSYKNAHTLEVYPMSTVNLRYCLETALSGEGGFLSTLLTCGISTMSGTRIHTGRTT